MKRLLSILLCSFMVFGNVAFALPGEPVRVEIAQETTATEIFRDTAELSASTTAQLYFYQDFEEFPVGVVDLSTISSLITPSGDVSVSLGYIAGTVEGKYEICEEDGNKYLKVSGVGAVTLGGHFSDKEYRYSRIGFNYKYASEQSAKPLVKFDECTNNTLKYYSDWAYLNAGQTPTNWTHLAAASATKGEAIGVGFHWENNASYEVHIDDLKIWCDNYADASTVNAGWQAYQQVAVNFSAGSGVDASALTMPKIGAPWEGLRTIYVPAISSDPQNYSKVNLGDYVPQGTAEGFTFGGWSLTDGGEKIKDNEYGEFRITGPTTFYAVNSEVTQVPDYKLTLTASSTEITTENGTVTITPVIETTLLGVAKTVSYKTDNSNVEVTKNADGTLTLTGKINGETIITAISDYDSKYTDEITITVSGQTPKTAFYDMNVFMLGNSILTHDYHAEWPQGPRPGESGFGMASTARNKDYAHRFNQVYLAQKYGVTEFDVYNLAAFEKEIKDVDGKDYTTETGFIGIIDKLKSLKNTPELITIQMGANVVAPALTPSQYENAISQLIDAIKEVTPNAQIIVCTSFYGGSSRIAGMEAVAKKYDLRIVYLNTLFVRENLAYDTVPGACETHPGDLGHDRIAQLLYEQADITITENIKPKYVLNPTGIDIYADSNTINTQNGTLQLYVSTTPNGASDIVKWSVDNENVATVDQNGVLTAVNNGMVTVTATSRLDENITATYEVEITNQTPCYTVIYNAGTEDTVTNLPNAFVYAKGEYTLSTSAPSRQYYIFEGWTINNGSKDVVKTIEISEDTNVYAVWRPAIVWTFDIDGYFEGVTTKAGFNVRAENGVFQALATDTSIEDGRVLNIMSPELNIEASSASQFVINVQNTAKADNTKFKLIMHTTNGDVEYEKDVTTTDFTNYTFDLTGVTGTITGFTFVPTNVDCAVVIDEMGFVTHSSKTVTYDANTTDTVTGLPNDAVVLLDKYTVSTQVPMRTGYKFIGWATASDSILPVKELMLTGNTTLYAIWDSNLHWDFSTTLEKGVDFIAASDAVIENGKLHHESLNSADPQVYLRKTISFDASKYSQFEFAIDHTLTGTATSTAAQLYWTTNESTAMDGNKCEAAPLSYAKSNGVIVYTIDLSQKDTWADTITSLRFDPISAKGTYSLDYIRFADADSESVFVIEEGMTENASEIPYSNVLVNGGTLVADGNCTLTNVAIASGNVDLAGGTIKVLGKFEKADEIPYVAVELPNHADIGVYLADVSEGYTYISQNIGYTENYIYKIDKNGTVTALEGQNLILTQNTSQVRTTGYTGIRFLVNISHRVKELNCMNEFGVLSEYGFVVGRADVFTDGKIPTLKAVEQGTALKGVAYNGTVDKIFDNSVDYDVISCVLYNIPMNKKALTTPFVVVPYATISGQTVYGQSISTSLYDAVKKIADANGQAYHQNKAYIDEILSICDVTEYDSLKVLAIGNSFSEDATAYLHQIAASANVNLKAVNLFIGGCTLETHAYNFSNDLALYDYQLNGNNQTGRKVSIKEALEEETWDVVTIQQASSYSGMYETYEPYGSELIAAIKQYAPQATICFHQTWAYDVASTHEGFANYGNSMETMHNAIVDTSQRFAAEHGLKIIPSGTVIDTLRDTEKFDCTTGINLCRDGHHMNLAYGRYAVAATWFETLTGKSIYDAYYFPVEQNAAGTAVDEEAVQLIKECVHEIVKQ